MCISCVYPCISVYILCISVSGYPLCFCFYYFINYILEFCGIFVSRLITLLFFDSMSYFLSSSFTGTFWFYFDLSGLSIFDCPLGIL